MSLCFDEAYQALRQSRITNEEYLHQVLAHFRGARHPADGKKRPWELMINDPVGNAIREAALNSQHTTSESINQLETLFASTLRDDVESVRTIVSQLDRNASQTIPLQAVATFAALHNDAEVLRLCVQMGASLEERNTSMALDFAARGPALLDVLYQYDWRGISTSSLAFNRMLEWSLHTGPSELGWFLDHDARVDKDTIRHAVRGAPVKASCISVLVQRYGVELFKETGLLQSAAKRGRNDIIKILLDAGVDVDELVPPSANHEGERELTALYEAVYKQHEDTVQLLLDHGADPNKQVCERKDNLQTPLKLAEGHDYSRVIGLLRRYLDRQPGQRTWTSKL